MVIYSVTIQMPALGVIVFKIFKYIRIYMRRYLYSFSIRIVSADESARL